MLHQGGLYDDACTLSAGVFSVSCRSRDTDRDRALKQAVAIAVR
jgi:hypothetical protein